MEEDVITTRDYTGVTTKQIVIEMLRENTGGHILDSGGAYGRNWERNQTKDFDRAPACSVDWSVWRNSGVSEGHGKLSAATTVSLYHWMNHCLQFDADLQAELDRFVAENEHESWLEVQELFADHLYELGRLEAEPRTVNTYNDPDNIDLSQVLQYVELYLDGDHEPSHLIISVHGGCDVRGGYTSPKVFRLRDDYSAVLGQAKVRCVGLGHTAASWYADDPCWRSFTINDSEGILDLPEDFSKLPAFDLDWLQDKPTVRDITDAIATADRQRDHLNQSSYPNKVELLASLVRVRESLVSHQLLAAATCLLEESPGGALLLADKVMYLVSNELPEEPFAKLYVYTEF